MSEMPDEIWFKQTTLDYKGKPFTIYYAHPCHQSDGYGHAKYIHADRYEALKQVAQKMAGALRETRGIKQCGHNFDCICTDDKITEALQAYEKVKGE